ncbi:MAG: DUF2782 domain-containing protein [Candidatus Competibacter sp.]|nr:DUF2782 domain-containing protein [Candidatus Competibacter sp.]
MRPWSRLLLVLLLSGLAQAQTQVSPAGLEPIPDGVPEMESGSNAPAPEVTIRQRGGRGHVEEYRAGGILYMVKIVPARGAPYYLVDTDGDGNFETRFSEFEERLLIPAWVLLRW